MNRIFLLIVLSFFLSLQISSQNEAKLESKRLMTLFHQLEGTFQIQVVNSRDKSELPLSIMDAIKSKRHATEIVYFPLKNNVRVMVLPYSVINKKGFVPIERTANVFEN